jgi:cystathionine beta-lyase
MDYEDMEAKIKEFKIHAAVFCSPHNPGGRVWTKQELERISEICIRHNVLVVSDEIHSDITFGTNRHTVYASLSEEAAQNCVICTSPSKTFNLAGLQQSNIFIPDPYLRQRFIRALDATGYDEPNIMGIAAAEAAYRYGDEWYKEVRQYIQSNIDLTDEYVRNNLPLVKMSETQGTYLVWLDFNKSGLAPKEIDDIICNKAKLWLDSGRIFGDSGAGFERINVACPKTVLLTALERIKRAFET